jgi:Flp pilus assembly protein TadG
MRDMHTAFRGDSGGAYDMRFIMALILLMIVFGASSQAEPQKAEPVAK